MRIQINEEQNIKFEGAGLLCDEFLPLVVLNKQKFEELNKGTDSPSAIQGLEVAKGIKMTDKDDDYTYTIETNEDEITIPLLVKQGSEDTILDDDGIISITFSEKMPEINVTKNQFTTKYGEEVEFIIKRDDPTFEKEFEIKIVAEDNVDDDYFDGELKDVLCGGIKIKFKKKEVKFETLRIKVLDCRSNEPIVNARVKKVVLNGKHSIEHEFNSQEFNKNMSAIDGESKIMQSQQALEGLGFDTNGPGNNYGDNGRRAYNDYWKSRFPELVDAGIVEEITEGNPTDEMLDYIIADYNGSYSTDTNGYINLQIPKELLDAAVNIEIGLKDFPILLEATHTSETNEENNVLRENDNTGNGTGYEIRWGNGTENSINDVTQNTDWNGNFGWHMKLNDRITQFKTSLQLNIKETDDCFSEFDSNCMSRFYQNQDSDYHLAFFAMQWCQPVWDGIEDAASGEVGAITEDSYIQHADYHGMNMHLASNLSDVGGSDYNGGKGYGKMEGALLVNGSWNSGRYRSDSHKGFDLIANIGANLFAIRAGKCTYNSEVKPTTTSWYNNGQPYNVTHNKLTLVWPEIFAGARRSVTYLHISQDLSKPNGHNESVMTGQIIGAAGRSGNLYWPDNTNPGHVHLNVGSYNNNAANRYTSQLYENHVNALDEFNIKIIPTNDFPLALPCKGELGDSSLEQTLPIGREATTGTGTTVNQNFNGDEDACSIKCWAAWELRCPLMKDMTNGTEEEPNIRIIQAQLKYLNYYVGHQSTHGLDGGIGNNTKAAIVLCKEVNGIEPVNDTITSELLDILNELGPMPTID